MQGVTALRAASLFTQVLGGHHMVVEDVEYATETITAKGMPDRDETVLIATVRPYARDAGRCSRCRRRCPGYDAGGGLRRWRTLDLGTVRTYLQAPAPRVRCPDHGVIVAHVPWARPGAKCAYTLEDTCAWLAANATMSVVAAFLRLSWRTVSGIITRVVADLKGQTDRLEGLRRIGIDEISYRKGHRYLTVVVDHDSGRMVWAGEGRNQETLEKFFAELGAERAGMLTHVSADGAEWIHTVVAAKAPNAALCLDPFHVVMWVMKALDKVRARTITAAGGHRDRHLMWSVRKNPADLTGEQRTTLAGLEAANGELYRAYLVKEQIREVFRTKGSRGHELLAGWFAMVADSGIPELEKVARTVKRYRALVRNTLDHDVTNGRSEATNTHLRGLTKRAYGFHTPEALIAMAELARGGLCPSLPGRN